MYVTEILLCKLLHLPLHKLAYIEQQDLPCWQGIGALIVVVETATLFIKHKPEEKGGSESERERERERGRERERES